MEFGGSLEFALMPANLITLPHFSVSSAMYCLKSAADDANTIAPKSPSRDFNFGSIKAALTSRLSVDDVRGCVSGCANTLPTTRLKSRHNIAHSRNVWQHLQSGRGRYGQRSKLAGPDVLNRRRKWVERRLDLSTNEVRQSRSRAAIVQ